MEEYKISDEDMIMHRILENKSIAYNEYFRGLEKQRIQLRLELGLFGGEGQKLYDEVKELRKAKLQREDDNLKTDMLFVTINPREDIPFADFARCMVQISRKKWLKRYIYVYEQRGENEDEIGLKPHAHLLFYRDGKKPSHVIQEIKNTVKHITDINSDRIFNVRFVKSTDANVQRLLNYIVGKKKDEDKHKKQEIDILFREKYKLLSHYSLGIDAEALLAGDVHKILEEEQRVSKD